VKDPRKKWRSLPIGTVRPGGEQQEPVGGDVDTQKGRGKERPSAGPVEVGRRDLSEPVQWLNAVAEIKDASQAMAALADEAFVAALFVQQQQANTLHQAFREFDNKGAVWRGLARMYPVSAPLLNRLNPLFDASIGGEVSDFLEALDLALERQLTQMHSLSDLFGEERREEMARAIQQVDALQARLSETSDQLSRMLAEHVDRAHERQDLERQLEARNREVLETERALEQERAEIDDLGSRLRSLDRRLEQVTQQRDRLVDELESARGRYQRDAAELERCEHEVEELEQVLMTYRGMPKVEALLREIQNLRERLRSVRVPDRLDGMGQGSEAESQA